MTALTGTLSRYLARQFTFWLLSVFCILTAIIEIFDAVELLRRASGKQDVGFGVLIQMALAKLPHLVQDLLPFVVLFGGMVAYWRMAKSSELVIARAAGVSIWQILAPAVAIACIVGIFQITAFRQALADLGGLQEFVYAVGGQQQLGAGFQHHGAVVHLEMLIATHGAGQVIAARFTAGVVLGQ